METLALFVLGPVVVLALLSIVSVLACRRLHHGRLQRLQEFDTEQGAIDGLITSNVGDSTLAVRIREVVVATMKRDSICRVLFPILSVNLKMSSSVVVGIYVENHARVHVNYIITISIEILEKIIIISAKVIFTLLIVCLISVLAN